MMPLPTPSPSSRRRDQLAGLRLLRAAIQLGQFTTTRLAKEAMVEIATARGFVRTHSDDGMLEEVPVDDQHEFADDTRNSLTPAHGDKRPQKGRIGRPQKIYRVVIGMEKVVHAKLDSVRRSVSVSKHTRDGYIELGESDIEHSTVALFETAVGLLMDTTTDKKISRDLEERERERLIELRYEQAKICLNSALIDEGLTLEALDRDGAEQASPRLLAAMWKFSTFRRDKPLERWMASSINERVPIRAEMDWACVRAPAALPHLACASLAARAVRCSHVSLLDPLVKQFGRWEHDKEPSLFEPMVVLLDGIKGEDRVSSSFVQHCRARNLVVVLLNIAEVENQRDRLRIYGVLDRLRATTPLAISDVVLTVDSKSPSSNYLVDELQDLANPGIFEEKAKTAYFYPKMTNDGSTDSWVYFMEFCLQIDSLDKNATSETDRRTATYVRKVTSALSVLKAARSEEKLSSNQSSIGSALVSTGHGQDGGTVMKAAVNYVMGHVFCLDISHSRSIETRLAGETIRYVPDAINAIEHDQLWSADVE